MQDYSNNIPKLFKEYRSKRRITQVELANILGISQATISLIEQDRYRPSHEVLDLLLKLYENLSNDKNEIKKLNYFTNYTKSHIGTRESIKDLSIQYLSATKGRSGGGDVFEIKKLSNSEVVIFLCDAVGHGDEAYLEAQILRMAFISHMTALPRSTNPLDIISSIRQSMRTYNSRYWSKNSILVAYVNTELKILEMCSFGIPSPILSNGNRNILDSQIFEERKINSDNITRSIYQLNSGECFVLFTDGLLDSGLNRRELETRIRKYNEMFPGDSKNILEKSIDINVNNIIDDVTVVVISKR